MYVNIKCVLFVGCAYAGKRSTFFILSFYTLPLIMQYPCTAFYNETPKHLIPFKNLFGDYAFL